MVSKEPLLIIRHLLALTFLSNKCTKIPYESNFFEHYLKEFMNDYISQALQT